MVIPYIQSTPVLCDIVFPLPRLEVHIYIYIYIYVCLVLLLQRIKTRAIYSQEGFWLPGNPPGSKGGLGNRPHKSTKIFTAVS